MTAVITAGCSSGFVPQREEGSYPDYPSSGYPVNKPTNGMVQSDTGGSVTIDIEWMPGKDNSLIFNVAMNTHSVNLDQYDLGKLAILRDATDNEYQPLSWDSTPGGHHRRGILIFSLPDSISNEETEYLEMVIRDVAGINERVLRWEL